MPDYLLHLQAVHDDGTTTTRGWAVSEEEAESIAEAHGEPDLTMFVPDAAALGDSVKDVGLHHWKGD